MAIAEISDLRTYCLDVAQRHKRAAVELACAGGATKNAWLNRCAELLRERIEALQKANQLDLDAAPRFGLSAGPGGSIAIVAEDRSCNGAGDGRDRRAGRADR